jgi:hypothetical protein
LHPQLFYSKICERSLAMIVLGNEGATFFLGSDFR